MFYCCLSLLVFFDVGDEMRLDFRGRFEIFVDGLELLSWIRLGCRRVSGVRFLF